MCRVEQAVKLINLRKRRDEGNTCVSAPRPDGQRLKGETARLCTKRRLGKLEAMFHLADAEAKRTKWGKRTRRHEVRMYYCQHCRAYHTTSKNNRGNDGFKRLAAILA